MGSHGFIKILFYFLLSLKIEIKTVAISEGKKKKMQRID
jgi:hypothetical protein